MATVYRAHDPSIDRPLVLKFLHSDLCAVRRVPHALPARGARRGRAGASQHRHHLRRGRDRGPAVHRDGAARRRAAQREDDAGAGHAGARRPADGHADRQRPRLRAQPRHLPSRHQAEQRPAGRRRPHRQDRRLRHRAGRVARRRGPDARRHDHRHAALHVARAGHRHARRRPLRSLLGRRDALPAADRRAALRGRQHGHADLPHRQGGAQAAERAARRHSAGAAPDHRALPRQDARGALPERPRARRRARQGVAPARRARPTAPASRSACRSS